MAVSRRALVLGGLGGLGVAAIGVGTVMLSNALPGGSSALPSSLPPPHPHPHPRGMSGPPGSGAAGSTRPALDAVLADKVRSQARGVDVNLITMTPEGVAPKGLPVCVALHGRGADANWFVELGLPRLLTDAVRSGGVRPFAVAALDGGTDSYWVDGRAGDDPQRMLTDEVPKWLTDRGFAGVPFAAFGISMGSFGALRYARRHRGELAAVAAISPALFPDWPSARARRVFAGQSHWEANEPLRHLDEIRGIPLGVWCGKEDPFLGAARSLVRGAQPEIAAIDGGAHDVEYWRRVLPDVLRFVGGHLR